jgi:hypothetical protein
MVTRFSVFWLFILAVCLGATAGAARAQVSVAVTSSVAITISPGASVSNAGTFMVSNTSGTAIAISSITLSASNGAIFSNMTMTGQVPGNQAIVVDSDPDPPGNSDSFNFSALPVLPNNEAATFTLGIVAVTSTTTTSDSSRPARGRVVYAGMMGPSPLRQSRMPGLLLSVLALGMLAMTGKLRRRHLLVLAMALVLAATEVGCGNSSSSTLGSSTQTVETVSISSGVATGLPAGLGAITVQ